MNHYEFLGVSKTATPAEIKKAYKRMAKKHHPDRAPPDQREQAHREMVLVNKAYDTLMDPAKREHYDLTGEEKPVTGVDIEARNSILQMFAALYGQGKINIPVHAASIANQALAKITAESAQAKRTMQEFAGRRSEVECSDGENLWHRLLDSEVEKLNAQIFANERKVEITKRVLEMLKAYRSGVVEASRQGFSADSMNALYDKFHRARKVF